jgi:hypothetical protein
MLRLEEIAAGAAELIAERLEVGYPTISQDGHAREVIEEIIVDALDGLTPDLSDMSHRLNEVEDIVGELRDMVEN